MPKMPKQVQLKMPKVSTPKPVSIKMPKPTLPKAPEMLPKGVPSVMQKPSKKRTPSGGGNSNPGTMI